MNTHNTNTAKYAAPATEGQLPTWATPGIVNVKHADYEPKQFRVRIEMQHPWFGITFMQDGIFKQKEVCIQD